MHHRMQYHARITLARPNAIIPYGSDVGGACADAKEGIADSRGAMDV
jgi:hypothetical protein